MDINNLLAFEPPGITIFGFKIYAYAIIIVCGMVAAFFVISLLFKRRNMSPDLFLTFFCICLPIAIVTTRLFYCITDGLPIKEWFALSSIRSGGLSIVGGIIGGAAGVAGVCFFKKVNFLRVGDCIVVGLLLAQSIGRWGNFANQEVYGGIVTNESLHFFPISVYIEDVAEWHYAFFFYESMVTLTAAALMFLNAWKNPYKPNGINTALYFVVYGLTRSIMEPLRDKSFILGDSVPWSMVMSICMLVAGLAALFVLLFLNKKKEGKLIGSLRGEPYGISEYIADNKNETAYFNKINIMCTIYPEKYPKQEKKEKEK
ncbi:MAG: prolipoprotein diacylglyceryl transferase [Clostridia bacterium]|nr:prolipoprotein diacylglyceryl transferase [Clostridia bacterium]